MLTRSVSRASIFKSRTNVCAFCLFRQFTTSPCRLEDAAKATSPGKPDRASTDSRKRQRRFERAKTIRRDGQIGRTRASRIAQPLLRQEKIPGERSPFLTGELEARLKSKIEDQKTVEQDKNPMKDGQSSPTTQFEERLYTTIRDAIREHLEKEKESSQLSTGVSEPTSSLSKDSEHGLEATTRSTRREGPKERKSGTMKGAEAKKHHGGVEIKHKDLKKDKETKPYGEHKKHPYEAKTIGKPRRGEQREVKKSKKGPLKEDGSTSVKELTDLTNPENPGVVPAWLRRVLSTSNADNEGVSLAQAMTATKGPKTRKDSSPPYTEHGMKDMMRSAREKINASDLALTPLPVDQPPVPYLAHGLDRVLFNPGVHHLQDPRSRVYNYDPYLARITPVADFDFNALKAYVTSSQDTSLREIANKEGKRYVGSTSSMSGAMSHFHLLLSQQRKPNTGMLSRSFEPPSEKFTKMVTSPDAIFLRWKDGYYAIDADKEWDTENILAMLGKSLEKFLTLPKSEYERYTIDHPNGITEEERNEPESFHFTTLGDFLLRSQLDAYDPRLPGTGMFDLKTRAVVSIRHNMGEYEDMSGYEITQPLGLWGSFEREYYDMIRSTMLKYSLQVRMGRMDGIFVAYHNIKRMFGFQYISLPEMDRALHGQEDTALGDQEFKISLDLLNKVLNRATQEFPKQTIRFFFDTRGRDKHTVLYVFAEPVTEEEAASIQNKNKERIDAFERRVLGLDHSEETDTDASEKDELSNSETEETSEMENKDNDAADESEADGGWEAVQSSVEEAIENDLEGVSAGRIVESGTVDGSDPEQASATNEPDAHGDPVTESKIEQTTNTEETPHTADTPEAADAHNAPTATDTSKPLLCMVLSIRNKVDNSYVPRPTNLTSKNKWTVEYELKEIASPHAWWLYEATQQRRRKAYDQAAKEEKGHNWYADLLREKAEKGREWRKGIEEVEEEMGEPIVFEPLAARLAGARGGEQLKREAQKVDDVD